MRLINNDPIHQLNKYIDFKFEIQIYRFEIEIESLNKIDKNQYTQCDQKACSLSKISVFSRLHRLTVLNL
jgi:hypothetical protein